MISLCSEEGTFDIYYSVLKIVSNDEDNVNLLMLTEDF